MDTPYIPRKFDQFLTSWKGNPGRNPLLVKGARQVGKTESIRYFARKNYESFIEINFVDTPATGMMSESMPREWTRRAF
jgi:predicted AAA+ superfamily ATPase